MTSEMRKELLWALTGRRRMSLWHCIVQILRLKPLSDSMSLPVLTTHIFSLRASLPLAFIPCLRWSMPLEQLVFFLMKFLIRCLAPVKWLHRIDCCLMATRMISLSPCLLTTQVLRLIRWNPPLMSFRRTLHGRVAGSLF